MVAMEFKTEKQVRFYNNGKRDFDLYWQNEEVQHVDRKPSVFNGGSVSLMTSDGGFGDKKRAKVLPIFGKNKVFPEGKYEPRKQWVIDPGSYLSLQWNRIFLFSCLVALFVDPLFFYLPSVSNDEANSSSCMTTDLNLGITVTCFRTLADIFYVIHVFIKFRTAYVSPSSRVFGKGELVTDLKLISKRYMKSDFFIDAIAALPLPQIVIWFIIPAIKSSHADHTTNTLVLIVLLQYIPRLYLIFPLSSQIIKTTGVVAKTAWAGAAYNLLLYMLASHVLGASWYLLSIMRDATCLKAACKGERSSTGCSLLFLDCGTMYHADRMTWVNHTAVFSNCNPANTTFFKFGIFEDAVINNVLSANFFDKYFYCLWWGLQNLSSYGQTLSTTTFIGETAFAILIAILGLVLFAHLIGNMQTYMQSITVRLEEWRLRRRDTEEWMRHRQLPQDLQERVRQFVQYKWFTTRGVDEESILRALPTDLRRDIKCHLCLNLVRRGIAIPAIVLEFLHKRNVDIMRIVSLFSSWLVFYDPPRAEMKTINKQINNKVPFFSRMDYQLLHAICERLVSSLSTQGTFIGCEGDPVTEMLFIIRGTLESSTTNGGRTGFFNSITLKQDDFCGEELLAWALLPKSALNLPSSTRTVKALSEVEAFALRAEDLKFVANQFRRLHSKELQHTFRYYSHHWRTRRHKKRKMANSLSMRESFSLAQDEHLVDGNEQVQEANNSQSNSFTANLGVTIFASRFAANTRRGAQKLKDVQLPKLQKPEEPDFSAEADEE